MAKRGQAMEGKRLNAFSVNPDDLVIPGLDTDDTDDSHPLCNKERNELPLDKDQLRNVMRFGILEPVLVRKNGPRFEVEAGRQRVKYAREANRLLKDMPKEELIANKLKTEPILVPVMAPRRDDDTEALQVMAIENSNRVDDSVMGQARMAKRLIDRGQGEADLMVVFGKSRSHVKNLLTLAELDDRVQKAVGGEKLAYTAALELKDLTRDEQWAKAQELIAAGGGVTEAKRQRKVRKAKKNGSNGDDTFGKRVPVTTLRKIATDKDFMEVLAESSARDLLMWLLGSESHAKRIKGLTSFLRGPSDAE
jgi:ParB-like chromosome segregation protein Spo0J